MKLLDIGLGIFLAVVIMTCNLYWAIDNIKNKAYFDLFFNFLFVALAVFIIKTSRDKISEEVK